MGLSQTGLQTLVIGTIDSQGPLNGLRPRRNCYIPLTLSDNGIDLEDVYGYDEITISAK